MSAALDARTFWCQQRDGEIIERVTSPHEGHRNCFLCIDRDAALAVLVGGRRRSSRRSR